MMGSFKRFFGAKRKADPVDRAAEFKPTPMPAGNDRELKETQVRYLQEIMAAQRSSFDSRRELAKRTLAIVSGDPN